LRVYSVHADFVMKGAKRHAPFNWYHIIPETYKGVNDFLTDTDWLIVASGPD